MKPVGPTPLPEHLYASRSLPMRTAAFWAMRVGLWGFLFFLIGGLFVFALYRSPGGTSVLHVVGRTLPMPIARVGDTAILYRDFQAELDGWIKFYETGGALEAVDEQRLHDRVLERMIERELIRQLSFELNVDGQSDVETLYQSMAVERGSEAQLIEDIDQRYGWTKNVFISSVVEPIVYARRVDDAVKGNEAYQRDALSSAQQARIDLLSGANAFTRISTGDEHAAAWVSLDAYPFEVEGILKNTEVGDVTEVIETSERFLVFKILGRNERAGGWFFQTEEFSIDKADVYDVLAIRRAQTTIKVFER